MKQYYKEYDFAIIGAGPAGVLAVAKIIAEKPFANILWLDPKFCLGKFGTTFAEGSGVPGNTSKQSYLSVLNEIYKKLPHLNRSTDFDFYKLDAQATPSLTDAAKPLQELSDELGNYIPQIKCIANGVQYNKTRSIYQIFTEQGNFISRKVIIASGAEPKTIPLASKKLIIPTETTFIKDLLKKYLMQPENQKLKNILVIGSSHSAALACLHLIEQGKQVTQWMNKPFIFAYKKQTPTEETVTFYDNTGLKGWVAEKTKLMLKGSNSNWQYYLSNEHPLETFDALVNRADAIVTACGYERSNSLLVNLQPLHTIKYNDCTGEILQQNGATFKGLYGIGIAFPEKVNTPMPERPHEYAVGVEKFWNTINRQAKYWFEDQKKRYYFVRLCGLKNH